ncbi:MAG TPA: hypothetical protein V6C71_17095 [Coleofasciculaceae cyanobacterium]|jgi:16S rRNA U516 pseudouridylate synthase RsuA-like enzyme
MFICVLFEKPNGYICKHDEPKAIAVAIELISLPTDKSICVYLPSSVRRVANHARAYPLGDFYTARFQTDKSITKPLIAFAQ